MYDRAKEPLLEAACWAHARRKFFEIHAATDSPVALEALERIGALYKIEAEIRGKSPDERRAARLVQALPQLTGMHAWLHATVRQVSRKSAIASAIGYTFIALGSADAFCQDGGIEIDNNAAERALRTVALGRKNYLFAGSDAGGERAAGFYSLIGMNRQAQWLGSRSLLTRDLRSHRRTSDQPNRRTAALEYRWSVRPNDQSGGLRSHDHETRVRCR